jgi:hypothetical protein
MAAQVIARVEVGDLASNAHREVASIEAGDGANGGATSEEAGFKRGNTDAERGNGAYSGYDNAISPATLHCAIVAH